MARSLKTGQRGKLPWDNLSHAAFGVFDGGCGRRCGLHHPPTSIVAWGGGRKRGETQEDDGKPRRNKGLGIFVPHVNARALGKGRVPFSALTVTDLFVQAAHAGRRYTVPL